MNVVCASHLPAIQIGVMQEYFSAELKRRADDAARKVAETLKKYKEKTEVIETLQATVSQMQ